YIDHAAFLGTINPDTNKIPKHLFQGYLNIYNNYFKAPWMPDRTEANPNELNQDDARYGFRCCHLKNIWTAPLPPETELSRQMTTSTTSIDIMGLQAAYANLHTDQERDYFMQRYYDVISSFGGKTSYDADNRPLLVMRSNIWASAYDVDGTDQTSLGQFSGRVQQTYKHSVIRVSLGTVRHPRRFKIVVIDIQITLKQMLRDFIGIRVNRAKKSGMVNITSSFNSRERSGINTILHELNPLFTINVTMRDIKSKNVYSRVNSKATTQWRKTESANGVHLEGVASDNRSS